MRSTCMVAERVQCKKKWRKHLFHLTFSKEEMFTKLMAHAQRNIGYKFKENLMQNTSLLVFLSQCPKTFRWFGTRFRCSVFLHLSHFSLCLDCVGTLFLHMPVFIYSIQVWIPDCISIRALFCRIKNGDNTLLPSQQVSSLHPWKIKTGKRPEI